MAKKKIEDVQPQAAVENGSENRFKAKEQSLPKSGIVTSEGNLIDRIDVRQVSKTTTVQIDYGKYNPAGKNTDEKRKGMRTLPYRALTPEQSKEYQRLYAADPVAARVYAVRSVFPMHLDDAAYHRKDTTVNGRPVNYILTEKITEGSLLLNALRVQGMDVDGMTDDQRKQALASMSDDDKTAALKGKESLVGKWQLSFGVKGDTDSRFVGILNREELASMRHRAEVVLDDAGKVKSVGAPLTLADIAGRMEQRVLSQREAAASRLESAQNVDWSRFKLPEGVNVSGLRFFEAKDHPDQLWLTGKVNGISVSGLLSKNETAALRNSLASLDQLAAANKPFRERVLAIIGATRQEAVTETAAVKAIVDRAGDATAKAFSSEQAGIITKYLGDIDGDGRMDVAEELWGKAKEELDKGGVNPAWQEDAHKELKDLAQGIVREAQHQLQR